MTIVTEFSDSAKRWFAESRFTKVDSYYEGTLYGHNAWGIGDTPEDATLDLLDKLSTNNPDHSVITMDPQPYTITITYCPTGDWRASTKTPPPALLRVLDHVWTCRHRPR